MADEPPPAYDANINAEDPKLWGLSEEEQRDNEFYLYKSNGTI